MNTPEHLIEDLTAALPALKKSPQVYDLFFSTVEKLKQVPPDACQRLMADIRAAYKGRQEQSIREAVHFLGGVVTANAPDLIAQVGQQIGEVCVLCVG